MSINMFILIIALLTLIAIISGCKVLVKAGRSWWAGLIPVLNVVVYFDIVGMSKKMGFICGIILMLPINMPKSPDGFLLFLFLILLHLILLYYWIKCFSKIAVRFGKSPFWGFFFLFLVPFIGWPILGFGEAKFRTQ